MDDMLAKLKDLHKQATTERSHYYVASCCKDAIAEIERLRRQRDDLLSYLNGISRQTAEMVKANS